MLYTCREFPDDLLTRYPVLKRKRGSRSGKYKRDYLAVTCAFDIETTRLDRDHSVMYIWQFQIGFDVTIIGRNWHEFKIMTERLKKQMPAGIMLVVLVHNLAFEFQFLRGIYNFKPDEVFLTGPRRPLRIDMYGFIEMRCTYLHSNMSLDEYLKKMGVETQKISGFDYDKKRYPWTPLSPEELEYCIHDVKGLVEAYEKEMQHDGDDLITCPLTSTGYVRRDVKKVMYKHRWQLQDIFPTLDLYNALRTAFRGGDTHANRHYAGQIVKDVYGYDRSSSYPDVQLNRLFPVGPFHYRVKQRQTWEEMEKLINVRGRAVLVRLAFWNIRLRDRYEGFPYISYDKVQSCYNEHLDNGRILKADYLEMTVTDVDLKILLDQYIFDGRRVLDMWYAKYGPLPDDLKAVIIKYYEGKTGKKGLDREKAKAKLNAVYGMSAQNPVKGAITLENGVFKEDAASLEELLAEAKRHAYFVYQWGVWTTAWARYELWRGRKNVTDQGGRVVYQDTDSVKYVTWGHDIKWEALNATYQAASEASGATALDPDGNRHYMGVYELEKGYPADFATRGAKKYAVDHNGIIKATIAGVSKKLGGQELQNAGGLKAFLQKEFVFKDAGGVELRYNDYHYRVLLDKKKEQVRKNRECRFITEAEGKRLKVRDCVTINPSTYNLHDTEDYASLLTKTREEDPLFPLEAIQAYMFDTFGKK